MEVLPFKIPKPENEALVYQEEREMVLYDQLHQHAEIQISFIEQGSGTLLVGDRINHYQANDILVLGSYVPHVFRSDTHHQELSIVHTLFFSKDAFGIEFFNLPDLRNTTSFFKKAEHGMKVLSGKKKLISLFYKIKNQNKIKRVASLLKVINHINQAKSVALSSFVYKKKYTEDEGKRMNIVFNYAMENYFEPITLEDVAEKANMSKNAFCRYFKKHTNKTFFQFLTEIRIENACKLIFKEPNWSISQIASLCGFQNTGSFNRKFKEIKGVIPSYYRSQHF